MRTCPNCGKELPDSAHFCPWCETVLAEKQQAEAPKVTHRKAWGAVLCVLAVLALLFWLPKALAGQPAEEQAAEPSEAAEEYNIPVAPMESKVYVINTSLEEYTVASHIRVVSEGDFAGCINLRAINVAEDNPVFTNIDGVLYTKDERVLIRYPIGKKGPYVVPEGTKILYNFSFTDCFHVPYIIVTEGVEQIAVNVFHNCSAKAIYLPTTLQSIGDESFIYNPYLTDLYYGGTEKQWAQIPVGDWNDDLQTVTMHYDAAPEDVLALIEAEKTEN